MSRHDRTTRRPSRAQRRRVADRHHTNVQRRDERLEQRGETNRPSVPSHHAPFLDQPMAADRAGEGEGGDGRTAPAEDPASSPFPHTAARGVR